MLPSELSSLSSESDFKSDTGEILWSRKSPATSYLQVDTNKFQSLTGRIANRTLTTSNLSIQLNKDASVSLLSLDDKDISASSKMLFAITSGEQNTNQKKDEKTGNMINWGMGPVIQENITGEVKVKVSSDDLLHLFGLNLQGTIVKEVNSTKHNGWITFNPTNEFPWYVIGKDMNNK